MKARSIQLQIAINELLQPSPPPGLLSDYKDFLRQRDLLPHYRFDLGILEQVIHLAYTNWFNEKRVNRYSLLQVAIQLITLKEVAVINFSPGTVTEIMWIFDQLVVKEKIPYRGKTRERICLLANSLLRRAQLTEDQILTLLPVACTNELVMNRVLRYPLRSAVISGWALQNFETSSLRCRRAELVGWCLDSDPDFVVSFETLKRDFDQRLASDKVILRNYLEEVEAEKVVKRDLGDSLDFRRTALPGDIFGFGKRSAVPPPEYPRRFAGPSISYDSKLGVMAPEQEISGAKFLATIEITQRITMLWGIFYSRLDRREKLRLYKKFYDTTCFHSIFRLAKKEKNIALLKWLMERE